MLFWILSLAICLALAMWAHKAENFAWALVACFTGLSAFILYPSLIEVEMSASGLWHAAHGSIPLMFIFAFCCVFAAALAEMSQEAHVADGEMQTVFAPMKK